MWLKRYTPTALVWLEQAKSAGEVHWDLTPIEQAREWLAQATSVAILTGAGISAESGVPTFRGAEGLWNDYKPEDLATPEAFARDPKTGLGVVRLAARTDRQSRAQRRAPRARAARNSQAALHADHAKRRRPARPRGQRQDPEAPRRHLAHALHRVRRELSESPRAAAQAAAPLRLRRTRASRAWSGSASRCRTA